VMDSESLFLTVSVSVPTHIVTTSEPV
jgi:hypothetical protein